MATIIQTPSHSCKHFVVVYLKWNPERSQYGYEIHYDEIIAWCCKNISGKWYSGKMQQQGLKRPTGGGPMIAVTEDDVGVAIFNFEDYNDKAHFILKWL